MAWIKNITHNDDFIILELPNQLIGIVSAELHSSFVSLQNLTNHLPFLYSFIDNLKISIVIRFSSNKRELFFLTSAPSYSILVDLLADVILGLKKFNSKNLSITLTSCDNSIIAHSIETLYHSPIKKTSNPKILKIGNRYWFLASIASINLFDINSFNNCIQDLLVVPNLYFSVHYKPSPSSKSKSPFISILFSFSSKSLDVTETTLKHFVEVFYHYKEQLSLKILFHNFREFKAFNLPFILGLSNVKLKNYRLEELISPELLFGNKLSKTVVSSPKIIHNSDNINSNNVILKEKSALEPLASPKKELKINSSQSSSASNSKHDNNIKQVKRSKQKYVPLIPYGIEVSDEELQKLLRSIPLPPS